MSEATYYDFSCRRVPSGKTDRPHPDCEFTGYGTNVDTLSRSTGLTEAVIAGLPKTVSPTP